MLADDPIKCHFCIRLNINKLKLPYGGGCSEMIRSMSENSPSECEGALSLFIDETQPPPFPARPRHAPGDHRRADVEAYCPGCGLPPFLRHAHVLGHP